MHDEFTAIFEHDGEWYIAYSPEIHGANGQGRTKQEAQESLAAAIALMLADRREEGLRAVPPMPNGRRLRLNEAQHAPATLPQARLRMKREGGSHSLWMNSANCAVEAVPRHDDIPNNLARKICRGLGIPEIG